jgi:hypothetical protein
MRWKKIGKIFDPRDHRLPNNCFEYAQSPQVLEFQDFVRIYFSTREKEQDTGKYLSHISFVDFDKKFNKIINLSDHTVIELGGLGCFDEHGIFPLNVVRYRDKIFAYIGGWNRKVSVSVDTAIGMATSDDGGYTFKRVGNGPVLSSSLLEPFLIGDPFVAVYEGIFHMWYIYGLKWKKFHRNAQPDRVYKIGHATSKDGIKWKKTGRQIISDRLNEFESQALPTVLWFHGKYHMFFCYRESYDFRKNKNRGYRIGYAFSDDLSTWIRDDKNVGIDVTEGSWDSDMMCYPTVFRCDRKIYMLYNGNEFGRYGFGLAALETND